MKTAKLLSAAALAAALPLSAGAAGARVYTDAEIIGVVAAANQGELEAAALASNKTKNDEVMRFAERMTRDHNDAKRKLADAAAKAALTPSDTDLSNSLVKHASDEAGQLGFLNGGAFDGAYVDAQVADHTTLLREIDEDLLPDAKDPSVTSLLRKLRPTVAHHLAMARRLQAELGRRSK
jgi:putative membrane protein